MKLNLYEIFKVKENQHFWINCDKEGFEEVCIKNNQLCYCYGDGTTTIYDCFDVNCFDYTEIYYKEPTLIRELQGDDK